MFLAMKQYANPPSKKKKKENLEDGKLNTTKSSCKNS
jgi:hypothetical protein